MRKFLLLWVRSSVAVLAYSALLGVLASGWFGLVNSLIGLGIIIVICCGVLAWISKT